MEMGMVKRRGSRVGCSGEVEEGFGRVVAVGSEEVEERRGLQGSRRWMRRWTCRSSWTSGTRRN